MLILNLIIYCDSYLHNRLIKIRNLRWETGPVIPESIRQDTLSSREKEYFMMYNNLLTDYNAQMGLDLTADLEVSYFCEIVISSTISNASLTLMSYL